MSNTADKKEYSSKELIARFSPYLWKYKWTLIADLSCAAMTTGCDLALPMIMRYITNVALGDAAGTLSMGLILKLGGLYLLLRVIDCFASASSPLQGSSSNKTFGDVSITAHTAHF